MARVSIITRPSLGETTGAAQPFDKPIARFCDRPSAIRHYVAQQEMAGEVEALSNLGPGRRAPSANESRQRQQLAGIGFGFGGAPRAPRLRADRDQIVVPAGDRAALKI